MKSVFKGSKCNFPGVQAGVGLHDPEDEGVYGGAKSGGPSLWLPLRDLPPSLCLESVLHYAEVVAAAAHWGLFPTLNHSLKAQRGDEFGHALQTSCFSGPAASSAGKREAQRGGGRLQLGRWGGREENREGSA